MEGLQGKENNVASCAIANVMICTAAEEEMVKVARLLVQDMFHPQISLLIDRDGDFVR